MRDPDKFRWFLFIVLIPSVHSNENSKSKCVIGDCEHHSVLN